MTPSRSLELERTGGTLTQEEMADGWHYCPEWDYMLVNMNDKEGDGSCCTCSPWTSVEILHEGANG